MSPRSRTCCHLHIFALALCFADPQFYAAMRFTDRVTNKRHCNPARVRGRYSGHNATRNTSRTTPPLPYKRAARWPSGFL